MKRAKLLAVTAAMLSASPALAQDDKGDNPGTQWLVINNTSQRLSCAWKFAGTGKPWHGWFAIPAGANWRAPGGGTLSFQCAAPVKRVIYPLEPGKRYSLLRAPDGSIDLIRVTVGR